MKPEARRYCPGPGLAHGGQEPQVGAWQGRLGGPLPGTQTLAPLTLDPVRPPLSSRAYLCPHVIALPERPVSRGGHVGLRRPGACGGHRWVARTESTPPLSDACQL